MYARRRVMEKSSGQIEMAWATVATARDNLRDAATKLHRGDISGVEEKLRESLTLINNSLEHIRRHKIHKL